MNILNIKTSGLTAYYLEQSLNSLEGTGLQIIESDVGGESSELELHYSDIKDLEDKLSCILEDLMDK